MLNAAGYTASYFYVRDKRNEFLEVNTVQTGCPNTIGDLVALTTKYQVVDPTALALEIFDTLPHDRDASPTRK